MEKIWRFVLAVFYAEGSEKEVSYVHYEIKDTFLPFELPLYSYSDWPGYVVEFFLKALPDTHKYEVIDHLEILSIDDYFIFSAEENEWIEA